MHKQELINRYLAAYNAFDIDGMASLLAHDVRFENHSGDQLTVSTNGIEAFRALAEQSRTIFSEREQRVTKLSETHESAIAEIAFRGVFAADIPDGPAAGSVIELQGRSEFTFSDGLISKIIDRS